MPQVVHTPRGKCRDRVVIQRRVDTRDAGNSSLEVYEDIQSVWCKMDFSGAVQAPAANQSQSTITGTLKGVLRSRALQRLDAGQWRAIEVSTGRLLNIVGCYDTIGDNFEWLVNFNQTGSIETGFTELIDDEGGMALLDNFGTNFALVEE